MEIVTEAEPPDNLCEGCLTHDRILAFITNDEIKAIYSAIINEKLEASRRLVLCFECIANIRRYILFKYQCAEAHEALIKHMVSPSKLTSLSKLSIVKNISQIHISYEDLASKTHENNIKYTPDNNESTQIEIPIEFEHVNTEKKEIKDIAFVKIEEDEALDGNEFYDDGFDQDDEQISAILTDYKKTKVKSKRIKRSLEDDFDASDEEPLNKKIKKTVRETKHKKKKDETSKEIRKPLKREKPPGVVTNSRVNKKLQQLNVGEGQLEMVVLSWEEVEQERRNALSSIVFTRHEYRCHDCIIGFNHKFKLDNHMKKHDPSAGEMICNVCRVRCRDSHALCAHRRRHRVRWRCCTCGDTSSRASVAADHVSRSHGAPPPTHTCNVCGHAETTLGKLRNHIKNHAERQKCDLCGKTFRDRTSLRTHLFIHKGEKEYSCPRCDKKFLFKKAMEVHLVTHDASAHLYCYQCDMNFKNRMSYTQHMKYSLKHIDPAKLKYACGLCDKKFVKKIRLHEHHLAVHLKATPVHCSVPACDFACSSRPVLRTHIRMVHRNAKALRNHVCDACGKTYTTKKSLEGHMRSHTGERPFKCALCPSTFGYEAALYNHNKLVHLKAKMNRRPVPSLTLQIPETPGPANMI